VLSATKRAATLVIKARNGRAADPKSIQINKIIKEKNIFLQKFFIFSNNSTLLVTNAQKKIQKFLFI
jgi:hypothetical protein